MPVQQGLSTEFHVVFGSNALRLLRKDTFIRQSALGGWLVRPPAKPPPPFASQPSYMMISEHHHHKTSNPCRPPSPDNQPPVRAWRVSIDPRINPTFRNEEKSLQHALADTCALGTFGAQPMLRQRFTGEHGQVRKSTDSAIHNMPRKPTCMIVARKWTLWVV